MIPRLALLLLLAESFSFSSKAQEAVYEPLLAPGYYIVVAAYRGPQLDFAKRFASKISTNGRHALYGYDGPRKFYYVYLDYYTNFDESIKEMLKTRKSGGFADAWVRIMKQQLPSEKVNLLVETKTATNPAGGQLVASTGTTFEVIDNPAPDPVYRPQILKNTPVFISLYNQTNKAIVQGEVEVVDTERSKVITKVKGNGYLSLPDPKSSSGQLTLICSAPGYAKLQHEINYKSTERDTLQSYVSLVGNYYMIRFDMQPLTEARPTFEVIDNPAPDPVYRPQILKTTPVFISLYDQSSNTLVQGDVEVFDTERSKLITKVKGNGYLSLPDPNSSSGQLTLIGSVPGYAKQYREINYKSTERDTLQSYISLVGNYYMIRFDMQQLPETSPNLEVVENPAPIPVYRPQILKSTPVFISLYNPTNNTIVQGDVEVVDTERSKLITKVKGNDYLTLPDPKSRSGQLTLITTSFGYRKTQHEINYKSTEQDTLQPYIALMGNFYMIKFDMVRLHRGDIATLYNVYFYNDAAVMLPESRYELNNLLQMMQSNPSYKVRLHGHTNGNAHGKLITMGEKKNFFELTSDVKRGIGSAKDLSRERAEIIRDWLIANGISSDRMEIKAWGGSRMLHDKNSPHARKNVRVEVEVLQD